MTPEDRDELIRLLRERAEDTYDGDVSEAIGYTRAADIVDEYYEMKAAKEG
jgi:hypothetical protein